MNETVISNCRDIAYRFDTRIILRGTSHRRITVPNFGMPAVRHKRKPLKPTDALAKLGLHLQKNYVLFGVELAISRAAEPHLSLHIRQGDTFESGLQQVVDQLPGYGWDLISEHLVNVHPFGAEKDSNEILNFRLSTSEVEGSPGDIIQGPSRFIPELSQRLLGNTAGKCRANGPGIIGSGPKVKIHVGSWSLRQFLNAVVQSELAVPQTKEVIRSGWVPVGWVYIFDTTPIALPEQAHTWQVLWSVRYWSPPQEPH